MTDFEKLWLNYYNDTLLRCGLISEETHEKMNKAIEVGEEQYFMSCDDDECVV